MKFQIQIPDEQFDDLTEMVKQYHRLKTPQQFIQENIGFFLTHNSGDNNITLTGKQVNDIGLTVGGKTLKTGDDIVTLFKNTFKINVSGTEVQLTPEDANALREQHAAFPDIPFEMYVNDIIQDALSLYLWGSTTGKLTYR